MASHPQTNGKCRDCLVWDVDETWRIEQPIWSETTVTAAVLPWRGAPNACVQPPAKNARLTTQMRLTPARQNSRRDGRKNYWRQTDVPAAVDGACNIARLCQILVCGVHAARPLSSSQYISGSRYVLHLHVRYLSSETLVATCLFSSLLRWLSGSEIYTSHLVIAPIHGDLKFLRSLYLTSSHTWYHLTWTLSSIHFSDPAFFESLLWFLLSVFL